MLIDFGGGFTKRWVNREVQGTIEGDLVALECIMKFIDSITSQE